MFDENVWHCAMMVLLSAVRDRPLIAGIGGRGTKREGGGGK